MIDKSQNTGNIMIAKYDKHSENIKQISSRISVLAGVIWREHYTSIIGAAQVEYMLDKFQTGEQIYEDIINNNFVYFTAENTAETDEHKSMVGYAACVPKEDCLFLSKLYVHKDYRRKGISRCFVNEMIALCKSEYQFNRIRLMISKINHDSYNAYLRMGFKNIDSVKVDIGNGFFMDDYVMELLI